MADEAETFWCISNKSAPGNVILRAAWHADRAATLIDAIFAQIAQRTDAISWFVFPHDQPADLSQRLEARGLPGGRGGYWLWADLSARGAAPPTPDGFRVERVRDDQMMAVWVRASEEGFGSELSIFYDAYARHGYGPDAFSRHYLGYQGDTPVTSGTLLEAGDCAAIYDFSTPPAFRQQGFGTALMHAMMQEIRERGYTETWIWSSPMAQSLYRQLGYIDADFGLREHKWTKPAAPALNGGEG